MSDDNKINKELLEEVKKLRQLEENKAYKKEEQGQRKFGWILLLNVNLIILVWFYIAYFR
jgi:hypothetical protein